MSKSGMKMENVYVNQKSDQNPYVFPKTIQLNNFPMPIFQRFCKHCDQGVSRIDMFNVIMDTDWKDFPIVYCILYTNKKQPFLLKEEKMIEDAMKEFHRIGLCHKVVFVVSNCFVSNRILKKDQLWAHLNLALENRKLNIPYYMVFEIGFESKIVVTKMDTQIGDLLFDIPWDNTFGLSLSTECFLNQLSSNKNYTKMWTVSAINADLSCLILTKNFMNYVFNHCKTLVKTLQKSYLNFKMDHIDIETDLLTNITEEAFPQYIPKNDSYYTLEQVLNQGLMYQTCKFYFGWKAMNEINQDSIFENSKITPKYIRWIRKYNYPLSALVSCLLPLAAVFIIFFLLKLLFKRYSM